MLRVEGRIVLWDHRNRVELLQDMQNVIAAFVAESKKANIPDEIIEKIFIEMICTAFKHQDGLINQHISNEQYEKEGIENIIKKAYKEAKDKGIL